MPAEIPDDIDHIDWQLRAQADPVPPHVLKYATMIANDTTSTIREKMLAACIVDLATTFNKMITSLEYGNVTLRVFEKNIQRNVKRP